MDTVFIVGHKNPDTDSISSAYCYGELKKIIDKNYDYRAARCGNANNQTKYLFNKVGVSLPPLLKDVFPRVSDIMTKKVVSLHSDDPMADVINFIEKDKIIVLPVVDEKNHLLGIIGTAELIKFFVKEDVYERPIYNIKADNIVKVIHGEIIQTGEKHSFDVAIMVGAMPSEQSVARIDRAGAEATVLVVGNRPEVIAQAVKKQIPAIIVTGVKSKQELDVDFKGYRGWVFLSNLDSAETIRRVVLASSAESVMNSNVETVHPDDYIDAVTDRLLKTDQRVLPVIADDKVVGVLSRGDLIKKHKNKLILMDHNEATQAIDGIETAEVLEIIDHHRLGAVKTNAPVYFYAKPVGSTCTLVFQQYLINNVRPSKEVAQILLGGILSDTVMLKSPTTTQEDIKAVSELEKIAGVDAKKFGVDMFSATDNLSSMSPESIVKTDFKMYDEFGIKIGVGQVEVVTLADVDEMKAKLQEELERQKQINGLNWALLLVTNIVYEESILLCTPFEPGEKKFSYRQIGENYFSLPGVLSRKKQLLPELLRILEELA